MGSCPRGQGVPWLQKILTSPSPLPTCNAEEPQHRARVRAAVPQQSGTHVAGVTLGCGPTPAHHSGWVHDRRGTKEHLTQPPAGAHHAASGQGTPAGGDVWGLCRSCCHPALCKPDGPTGAPSARGSLWPGAGPASMRPLLGKADGGGSSSGFSMFLLLELIKVETQAEGADCSWGGGQRRGQPPHPEGTQPQGAGRGKLAGQS